MKDFPLSSSTSVSALPLSKFNLCPAFHNLSLILCCKSKSKSLCAGRPLLHTSVCELKINWTLVLEDLSHTLLQSTLGKYSNSNSSSRPPFLSGQHGMVMHREHYHSHSSNINQYHQGGSTHQIFVSSLKFYSLHLTCIIIWLSCLFLVGGSGGSRSKF